MTNSNLIQLLTQQVRAAGGQAFLVGGFVRDTLLGYPSKDLDLECYGLTADELLTTVAPLGQLNSVGVSFEVLKLRTPEGDEVDLSLPRRDTKVGPGHTGFVTEADPYMDPKEACGRRDFTINAMMMNPIDGHIEDYYDGQRDLELKLLRHTTAKFVQDPLRVLRAMQFAGRFEFELADETVALARDIRHTFRELSSERIFTEFEKLATKSVKPSLGIKALIQTEWILNFVSLTRFVGNESSLAQSNIRAIDALASLYHVFNITEDDERAVLFFATLLRRCNTELVEKTLDDIRAPLHIVRRVLALTAAHSLSCATQTKTLRMLAVQVAPASVRDFLIILKAHNLHVNAIEMMQCADSIGVLHGPEKAIINGDHLQRVFGMTPGKELGTALKTVYRAQLNEEFATETDGLAWVRTNLTNKTVTSAQK